MAKKTIIDDMEERHLEQFVAILEQAFADARKVISERVTEMVADRSVVASGSAWKND